MARAIPAGCRREIHAPIPPATKTLIFGGDVLGFRGIAAEKKREAEDIAGIAGIQLVEVSHVLPVLNTI